MMMPAVLFIFNGSETEFATGTALFKLWHRCMSVMFYQAEIFDLPYCMSFTKGMAAMKPH